MAHSWTVESFLHLFSFRSCGWEMWKLRWIKLILVQSCIVGSFLRVGSLHSTILLFDEQSWIHSEHSAFSLTQMCKSFMQTTEIWTNHEVVIWGDGNWGTLKSYVWNGFSQKVGTLSSLDGFWGAMGQSGFVELSCSSCHRFHLNTNNVTLVAWIF